MNRVDWMMLRSLLEPLVARFEIDRPGEALLGVIPVIGGTFVHPLTRQPVGALRIYGAGPDQVKILEPRFLRSLPRLSVLGLAHPTHFCAAVARALGDALGELGRLRDAARAMGLALDLDPDMLRLRGRVILGQAEIEVWASRAGRLEIAALGARSLTGLLPRAEREIRLTGQSTGDLDELARLAAALGERIFPRAPAAVGQSLDMEDTSEREPTVEAEEVRAVSEAAAAAGGGGDDLEPVYELEPVNAAAPGAGVRDDLEPVYELEPVLDIPERTSAPPPPQGAASTLEDETAEVRLPGPALANAVPAPAPAPRPAAAGPAAAESLGALELDYLFKMLNGETQISAHGGRLRLVVPFKVVQGEYTFYLEQVGPKQFKGTLVTPSGSRHRVEVDLTAILDIKDVFDHVMMGK